MDVASLLMERFSSVLSCSVGKKDLAAAAAAVGGMGGGGGGGWGGLFSRISSCGGDEIGILSALVTFGSHAEGNPVSSLTCSVMSESHCSTAEMHIFENCTTNIGFQRVPVGTTVATRSLTLKSNLRHWRNYVCRNLKLKHYGLVKCGLALLFHYLSQFKRQVHLRRPFGPTAEQHRSPSGVVALSTLVHRRRPQ